MTYISHITERIWASFTCTHDSLSTYDSFYL